MLPHQTVATCGLREPECWPLITGRAHAAALLPAVVSLIEQGRLRPGEVTTRVVGWEDAPRAYLEPAIKLIVRRA